MNRSGASDTQAVADEPDSLALDMVEATPDALVVVDEAGVIEFVNRQTEVIFGFDRTDLLGRPVEVLLPDRFASVHTAHRTRFRVAPEVRAMGNGMKLLARRSDGSEFPVEVSLSPLMSSDGLRIIAAVRDITERVAAEARDEEVRRVLDAVEDGVFMFDVDTLRFTYVNQGAVRQVGYSRDELLTMGPLHIKPEFVEETFRELMAPLLAGDVESTHFETMHRGRDGVDVPVEIVLQSPSNATSRRVCVALVRDIRERLRQQAELSEARQEASLLAERERIARDMHDTVIGRLFGVGMALQGTAGLVEDATVAEHLERMTTEIDEALQELRATVYGLRSRHDWGRGFRGQVLSIAADQRAILGFEPRVDFTGPIDELPPEVTEEVVATLRESLTNIAKYAEASRVSIALTSDEGAVRLEVVDNGVGFRVPADPAAGDPIGTTGHGIRNMSARAEAFGGRLEISSKPGEGTTIDWRIPNRDVPNQDVPNQSG